MSAKSTRHHQNQQAESRLLDQDLVEQRALQIARDEGRETIEQDDRERAQEELFAPNETGPDPELTASLETQENQLTAWDEAPGSSGHRAVTIKPEDEASIGKELVEKGLRGPRLTRQGTDPLERESNP